MKLAMGCTLAIIASFTAAGRVRAQSAPAQTAADGIALTEIVVTAQKRESKLETTPMTLDVLSGNVLQEMGMREIKDLSGEVPGLAVNESPGGFSGVSIRGIGTTSASQLFEQSVGLFVDGVYNPRALQFRNALFDVERVEVIEGSEGVLFGKNTSVGAISVISRRPGKDLDGYIAANYETEFQSRSLEGAVDLPVNDRFAVRLAGLYSDENGYMHNYTLNREEPQDKRWLLRGTFDWQVTDAFTASLKLQAADSVVEGNDFKFLDTPAPGTLIALGVADAGNSRYNKYESSGPLGGQFDDQRSYDPTLTLNWDLGGGYRVTSVSGYSKFNYAYGYDSDSTPVPLVFNYFEEEFHQFTQEVRLTSPAGQPVEFIVGAFYQTQRDRFDYQLRFLDFPILPPIIQLTGIDDQLFQQKETAYAGFGEIGWHISPDWRLDVGGRLSQDDKTGSFVKTIPTTFNDPTSALPFLSPPGSTGGKIDNLTFDASGTLSYNLTPTSVLYATVGRGTKGGAFNNTSLLVVAFPDPLIVPKEVATTYELGIKGRLLDGRAYASLSAYHLDIHDFQDSYYSSVAQGFLIRSIGAQSTGLDGEARFQFNRWLNLYGNFSYAPVARLADGQRTQRSPEFTAVAGTRFAVDLNADLKLSGNVELDHSNSYYNEPPTAPGNNESGSYNLLNGRLALTYVPWSTEFSVRADNLTDQVYKPFSFGSPLGLGTVGTYNRPRTVWVGAKFTF